MTATETISRAPAPGRRKFTAVETIILAASRFAADFSKWDLTVAAWELDSARFGMRGHDYPDTNRVMMEVVGSKPSNPFNQGFFERAGPSRYRLTPSGRALAAALKGRRDPAPATEAAEQQDTRTPATRAYDDVRPYATHAAFLRWRANPAEPRELPVALDFFGLTGTVESVRALARSAYELCTANGAMMLVRTEPRVICRGSRRTPWIQGAPIPIGDLADLGDFLTAIEHRFPNRLPRSRTGQRN